MTIAARFVAPTESLATLAASIRRAQGDDPLAPVSVVVSTNAVGVTVRRWLGGAGGIAAVDMVTPARLAERIAGAELVSAGRRPISQPVLDLAVRAVLADEPGSFADVAAHPSTVSALRAAHVEVRRAGPGASAVLATAGSRGREVARVSDAVATRLRDDWYDEADLFEAATRHLASGTSVDGLAGRIVVYEPALRHRTERLLIAALDGVGTVDLLVPATGIAHLDDDIAEHLSTMDIVASSPEPGAAPGRAGPHGARATVISTTDADDEVRQVVRRIVDAARAGTSFGQMCVLWPADVPYARLVEHHLDIAGVPWNGRPGTQVAERLVPRFLLDLLDLDQRGLRRVDLFHLLADVPQRAFAERDGAADPVPVATWERVAIEAGVTNDDHWVPRLRRHAARLRARAERDGTTVPADRAAACDELLEFVRTLRTDLGHPRRRRPWSEWADWCSDQVATRLGDAVLEHLDAAERLAADHAGRVLDRLRGLDVLSGPVTRSEFRSVFAAEFEQAPGRLGRIGEGVTIGSITADLGLDATVALVLGAADGVLPAPPPIDPLLSERDRDLAGLPAGTDPARRAERRLVALAQRSDELIVTVPRGDLRTSAERPASRWIDRHLPGATRIPVSSQPASLAAAAFPAHRREHRLRALLDVVRDGPDELVAACADDAPARRGLALRAGRRRDDLTVFDGDLTGVVDHRLVDPVSPSQLEAWPACPHGYFARYILGVRAPEDVVDELQLTPLERGNVVHETLDRFHREVIEAEPISGVPGSGEPSSTSWSDRDRQRLIEVFDEVADEFERAGRVGRPAAWAVDRVRVRTELLRWIDHDDALRRQRGTSVRSSELRFGDDPPVTIAIDDDRPLRLRGAIDRIDLGADGTWYVTDHKTGGSKNYSTDQDDPTAGGTRFQLPVYAAAVLAHAGSDASPDAVVHAEYSFLAKGGFARKHLVLDRPTRDRVAGELSSVVAGVESGLYPSITEPPKYQHYVTCHYCDPDGLGVEERYGEWRRKQYDPRLAPWFEPEEPGS